LAKITPASLLSNSRAQKQSSDNLCRLQFYLLVLMCFVIFSDPSDIFAKSKATDLRILIDVSGSMKENDPQNLRAPSVRMLIGLIPNGTKAGIWTFGKYVNMQVKHGLVNTQWKKLARKEATKIHSRGLYTNIEDVIKKSTYDWRKPDPNTNRHLILLTDGVVDISKNPDVNLKSKHKIIDYYLPRLKRAGVKVHTISLSQHADHDLLKLLSVTTDGWYELIEDPTKLHRVFLRLFEKSTSANALPLENNTFNVDKSIKDMTVLSFNSGNTVTKLITPSKKVIIQKNKSKSISWFHEDGYDLITITKPEAGAWQLDASVDKDNRVLVVTNLTLSIDDIPNNVLLNQRIIIKAALQQKGKNIHNKSFLELVKVKVVKKSLNDPEMTTVLYDNGERLDSKANDGVFNNTIRSPLRAGVFELIVSAKGPTFERQRQFIVNVFNGLAEIEIHDGKEQEPFHVEVIPHTGLLLEGSVDVSYQIDDGATQLLTRNDEGQWKLELPVANAEKKLSVTIKGLRQNNKSVEMQMERILPIRVKKETVAEKHVEEKSLKSEKEHKISEPHSPNEDDGGGWMDVLIWVLIINFVLIMMGGILYFVLKKRRAKAAATDEDELAL